MDGQLTQSELDRFFEDYERDGYLLVRNALSVEEMGPIQAQWQRVRDELRKGKVIDGMNRDNFYIHGKLPSPVGDVYKHPTVVNIVKRLLGNDLALYLNRLNVKDTAFHDLIHLHQDIPYFNGGEKKINVFLALQDINLNNGAMVYVPKSHKLGILDRNTIDLSKHPELDVWVPSLRPGDLVFAHINLWHSSVPNTQQTDRVLLQMIYQPATDGSFYPLSVPKPILVAGDWKTKSFTPWQRITSATGSQLDNDKKEGEENDKKEGEENDKKERQGREKGYKAAFSANHNELVGMLKSAAPGWIKQPVKDLLSKRNILSRQDGRVVASTVSSLTQSKGSEWILPEYFTASTGPKQVWPLQENAVNWLYEIKPTVRYLKKAGKRRILVAACQGVSSEIVVALQRDGLTVCGYVHIPKNDGARFAAPDSKPIYASKDLPKLEGIDAIVVLASRDFSYVIRRCEQFLRSDIVIVPATREAIVPEPIRTTTVADWATRSSILTYLHASGLHGNFAEFGTFWGRSFYSSYYELNHWLRGKFYAFDSFEGLSDPDKLETAFTSGDFVKGAYGFSRLSFDALAEILGLPKERIVTVPGFFAKSLNSTEAQRLGIAPKSLSVVRIDCDLFDPTKSVLEFVAPLLDDGALVYFDDWRLCRADPRVGERGAGIEWLASNPGFELVDFHSIHWQHQWFIFHRNSQTRANS
jgi:hypothetical protein